MHAVLATAKLEHHAALLAQEGYAGTDDLAAAKDAEFGWGLEPVARERIRVFGGST